jgi:rare lipoprotein A
MDETEPRSPVGIGGSRELNRWGMKSGAQTSATSAGAFLRTAMAGAALLALAACAHAADEGQLRLGAPLQGARPEVLAPGHLPPRAGSQQGIASWYGSAFAGKATANGERFDPEAMTAAHRELPFGTWVEVRRVDTGRAVRVRVNDRGPFGDVRRVIDLSRHAAAVLGMVDEGAVEVELRVVRGPE